MSIKDSVNWFSHAESVRQPMVRAIDVNQNESPVVQVIAPAAALVCLCDALDLDPVEVVMRIRRMANHVDSPYASQWRGMKAYAQGELRK